MNKNCNYKELRIVFDSALEEILIKEIELVKPVRYLLVPNLKVSWSKDVKHLNTHVWPGTDEVLIIVLEEKECYELLEVLLILKDNLSYQVTFDIVIKSLEYVNFQK